MLPTANARVEQDARRAAEREDPGRTITTTNRFRRMLSLPDNPHRKHARDVTLRGVDTRDDDARVLPSLDRFTQKRSAEG